MGWFQKKSKIVGASSLLATGFIYGWFGIFSKLIAYDLPLFFASLIRDVLGVAILGIILYFSRSKNYQKIGSADLIWIVLRSVFGLISFFSSYIAFVYLEIGTAYFIYFGAFVLAGYLLGLILFKEKIDLLRGSALILALLGLYIIYHFNFTPNSGLYILLAALSGATGAIWNIFSKKVSDKYSALQLNFMDFVFFGSLVLILSILRGEVWVAPELSSVWLFNLIFGLSFVLTGQLIVIGFNNLDAQIGSLIMLTEIVFGIILGFVFFQETVTLLTLLGGLLIVTAVALPELQLEKKPFWKKLLKR